MDSQAPSSGDPDFIIIGAPRSGTTSLYSYLQQHPQLYMSPLKEPRFFAYEDCNIKYQGPADGYNFNRNTITDFNTYHSLFAEKALGQYSGEASPVYLYRAKRASKSIQNRVPNVRLIAILRNPVERAYSDYLNMVRLGWEPIHSFEQVLADENRRISAGWSPFYHYRAKGFYSKQIRYYLERFDRRQLRFYLYEDLQSDADELIYDLLTFIGVNPDISIETITRYNQSGVPRSTTAHYVLTHSITEQVMRGPLRKVRTKLRDWNTKHQKPTLNPAIRSRLQEIYRSDILSLQDLLKRDLTHWLS